jgi:hypothetical protein
MTSRILAVLATLTVNVTGTPAETGVVGPLMLTPVLGFSFTVTVAVLPATFAVTIVSREVVSVVRATPSASVTAVEEDSVPLSLVNVTGTPEMPRPAAFSTRAATTAAPPDGLNVCGLADRST